MFVTVSVVVFVIIVVVVVLVVVSAAAVQGAGGRAGVSEAGHCGADQVGELAVVRRGQVIRVVRLRWMI